MKHIIIELCEVNRRQGKTWIDIIASRPADYQFTECGITAEYLVNGKWQEEHFSFEFEDRDEVYLNVPISDYVSSDKAMYKVSLYALDDEDEGISETSYISDVEFVYHEMLHELLKCEDKCASLSDDLIKKYLMLYGHQLASRYNETYELSSYLYKKIISCNSACQTHNCQASNNCGCKL